jgi:hypothetical protein
VDRRQVAWEIHPLIARRTHGGEAVQDEEVPCGDGDGDGERGSEGSEQGGSVERYLTVRGMTSGCSEWSDRRVSRGCFSFFLSYLQRISLRVYQSMNKVFNVGDTLGLLMKR